jgi:hypothetical protein
VKINFVKTSVGLLVQSDKNCGKNLLSIEVSRSAAKSAPTCPDVSVSSFGSTMNKLLCPHDFCRSFIIAPNFRQNFLKKVFRWQNKNAALFEQSSVRWL